MRASTVLRAIAFDGNDNPLLIPFSALSASLDPENKALVLSMSLSDGDPYVLITHDLGPNGPYLACAEIIGQREEVDIAATVGKLAVTAVSAALIAKGTHHLVGGGSHQSYNETGGLNADSGSPSGGIGAIGAGSALLHLGHSGPEKTNIVKVRLSIMDGTEVVLEMGEAEFLQLDHFEGVRFGETLEQFMQKRFAEIAGRLEDGEQSFSELDLEAKQLQSKIHDLEISLTQMETYETRDRARKSLELLREELFLKDVLKGSLIYLFAYDKAYKSGNFELFDRLKAAAARRSEINGERKLWKIGVWVAMFFMCFLVPPFGFLTALIGGFFGLTRVRVHFDRLIEQLPNRTKGPLPIEAPTSQINVAPPPLIEAATPRMVVTPPQISPAPPQVAPVSPQLPLPAFSSGSADAVADCVLHLFAADPVPAPEVWAIQQAWAGKLSKPVNWLAKRTADGDADTAWQPVDAHDTGRYCEWAVAMQLVDRRGPVSDGELARFFDGVQQLAQQTTAALALPSRGEIVMQAAALDEFCATVDIQFVLHVVDASNGLFAGPKIQGMAEAAGLVLEADGVFRARDAGGGEMFTLANLGAEHLDSESLKSLVTQSITLSLDVPRVTDGTLAFDRMLATARQLAGALGGVLVDAQRTLLADTMVDAIRAKTAELQHRMREADIVPGSPLALRLFS